MIIVHRHSMVRDHPGARDVRLPLGRQHATIKVPTDDAVKLAQSLKPAVDQTNGPKW